MLSSKRNQKDLATNRWFSHSGRRKKCPVLWNKNCSTHAGLLHVINRCRKALLIKRLKTCALFLFPGVVVIAFHQHENLQPAYKTASSHCDKL